jgi:hypothetical protein
MRTPVNLGANVRKTTRHSASAPLLAAILALFAAAACDSTPPKPTTEAAKPAEPAVPPEVLAAARGAYGPDAEVLGYGTFFNAGGSQALVIRRLTVAVHPAGAAPAAAPPSSPNHEAETAADVIHVSILKRDADGTNWQEAFRADEHLKNQRGYMTGAPAAPVPAWHLVYEQTPDDGFKLEFTLLALSSGSKQARVRVAWNPKRQEYDSLDASGTKFLEPRTTPGGDAVLVKPR